MSAAILLASFHPGASTPFFPMAVASTPGAPMLIRVATATPEAVNPLAREPLYADIIARAGDLRIRVEAYRAAAAAGPLPGLDRFESDVAALSALDMQGHVDLAKRGTDGDLKCILKGISQDLPKKLAEVEQASTADDRSLTLKEMAYLLRDNVEVITTPPTTVSGTAGL